MKNENPIIQLSKICYAYDQIVALRYVSMDIYPGETIVLQGPNGCGKSTLLKLLNGLIFPQEGKFLFDKEEITQKKMKNRLFSKTFHQRIGFVFQNADIQLFCGSVEEEIAFGPMQMGLSLEEVQKRTSDCIRLFNLEHLKDRAPYHLSGGEKRKVAFACVLSLNPEVLIIDEPLAGLDRKTQEWLTGFLSDLKKAGKTMIISTHNDDLAQKLATRMIYMNEEHEVV